MSRWAPWSLVVAASLLPVTSPGAPIHDWRTLALSNLGAYVAVQDSAGSAWVISSHHHQRRLKDSRKEDAFFEWSADDRSLAVEQAGSISVYNPRNDRVGYIFFGTNAGFSPDGTKLAYIHDRNVWVRTSDGKSERPLTSSGGPALLAGEVDAVYGRTFGVSRHFWWSPDSASIAYIETAYPAPDHSVPPGARLPSFRLKIIDLKTGSTTSVYESSDDWAYLLRVTWHPDSKRLLYYRMNRPQTLAELCIYDSGKTSTILTERDAYWVNAPLAPQVVSNGTQLLVSSERSGHRHIYVYGFDGTAMSGSGARDVTEGDFEVNHLYPGAYVTAGAGAMQQQQLFHLNLQGGQPTQLTRTPGWHDIQMGAGGSAYLDISSTATTPPTVYLGSQELLRAVDTSHPVAAEYLPISMHDGVTLPSRLYKPSNFEPTKKYPLIVYTSSGPAGRVVRDAWGGWEMAWNREMVRKGYLVLALDVRGSAGYGHLFEEYIHYRLGAQEMADLREAAGYLRRQPYVDADRIGIWGSGYGGHVVVHALLEFPGGFAAGVALAPIIDWRFYNAYFTERYLGLPKPKGIVYDDSSALDSAKRMTGTLLAVEDPGDPTIGHNQIETLSRRMARIKKPGVFARYKTMTAGEDLPARMSDFFTLALQQTRRNP